MADDCPRQEILEAMCKPDSNSQTADLGPPDREIEKDWPISGPQTTIYPDDGGPAFPVSIPGYGDNGWQGMSLRDWFAGLAMSAGLGNDFRGDGNYTSRVAAASYVIADAMMKARRIEDHGS